MVQQILPTDYKEIVALQNEVYPAFLQESMVVLTSKVFLSPHTCLVDRQGDSFRGYVLAIPYPTNEFPSLNESVQNQDETENIYISDCVVPTKYRGNGIASELIEVVIANARLNSFKQITLVAVQGASSFWEQFGFTTVKTEVPQGYGDQAVPMIKLL